MAATPGSARTVKPPKGVGTGAAPLVSTAVSFRLEKASAELPSGKRGWVFTTFCTASFSFFNKHGTLKFQN